MQVSSDSAPSDSKAKIPWVGFTPRNLVQNSFRTGFILAIVGTPTICLESLSVSRRCCTHSLSLIKGNRLSFPSPKSTVSTRIGAVIPASNKTLWTPTSASSSLTLANALMYRPLRGFRSTSALASSTRCLQGASEKQMSSECILVKHLVVGHSGSANCHERMTCYFKRNLSRSIDRTHKDSKEMRPEFSIFSFALAVSHGSTHPTHRGWSALPPVI